MDRALRSLDEIDDRYASCSSPGMRDAIGWISSLVLLLTILEQVRKQWVERSNRGVSSFLFIGQTAASLGFTVYSALLQNWVFTVTNGLMLASGLTGWCITAHFKHNSAPRHDPRPNASSGELRLGVNEDGTCSTRN